MAPINRRIAARVKALLAERHITYRDYYTAIGIPDRTGARRLAGTSPWTTDELAATAAFLGVDMSVLTAPKSEQVAS